MGKKRRAMKHPEKFGSKFGRKFAKFLGFRNKSDAMEEVVESKPLVEDPAPATPKKAKSKATKKTPTKKKAASRTTKKATTKKKATPKTTKKTTTTRRTPKKATKKKE